MHKAFHVADNLEFRSHGAPVSRMLSEQHHTE